MGKTSLALKVLHHEDTKLQFKSNVFFVSCEGADTGASLLSAISSVLKLPDTDTDPFEQLILYLQEFPNSMLLILDNFETPWQGNDLMLTHTTTI